MISRLTTVSLVLLLIGYLLPGCSVLPLSTSFLVGFTITSFGFLSEILILKRKSLPYTYGLNSFVISFIGLTLIKLFLPDVNISWLGLVLSSLIIGLVELIIPTTIK
jgi:hypothetical protein